MNKKAKKPVKKATATTLHPFLNRLSRNRGEWLTICINLTERAMSSSENDPMETQWVRLHSELETFKRDNPTEKIRTYIGVKLTSEVK